MGGSIQKEVSDANRRDARRCLGTHDQVVKRSGVLEVSEMCYTSIFATLLPNN